MTLAVSTLSLVLYPFLTMVILAGSWVLVAAVRRGTSERGLRKARKLAKAGRFDEMTALLVSKGKFEAAAELLKEQGEEERAVAVLISAGDYVAAARQTALTGDNQRAAELFQRGGDLSSAGACLLAAGSYDEAIRLLRQCGELAVAARFVEQRNRPDLALKLQMELGNYGQASALALEHLKERKHLKAVADALVEEEQLEPALPLLLKGHFFLDAGRALARLGNIEKAIEAFLHQNHYEEAANLLARTGRHREAAEYFLKGGSFARTIEELLLAGEVVAAARLHRRSGDPAKALEILSSVSTDSSDYRTAQVMAASIEEESHRLEQAAVRLQELLKVIGHSTENLELVYRVVDLLLQVGRKDDAIACLERTKRAGATAPDIDEQLMTLRAAPDGLFEPDIEHHATAPARRRSRVRGNTTTVGFPRSERYVLKRKLARGGHGILFLVEDQKLQRDVVLKLLHSESLPSDLARKYFIREARTAARLNHPGIVRVFDYGEIETRPYLAMEYVEGLNLIELQESLNNRIPFDRSLSICIQLCEALTHAHQETIIHRDIKMENVMVTTQWQTKLLDFGLAKALNENPDRSLFIIGTPFYMSPEQIVGDVLDLRTDIYSAGILMYRLFTGRLPFEEGEVLTHHRFTLPPDPREFEPKMPRLLAETILTCIKKDRDERFDSATLVAQRLSQIPPGPPT
jgi:eukaryotic-like serine/threonine-protein kinase